MAYLVRWLLFVARLVLVYATVGAAGAFFAFAAITAYAFPMVLVGFLFGASFAAGGALLARAVRRARRSGSALPFSGKLRAFMSEGGWHHGHMAG